MRRRALNTVTVTFDSTSKATDAQRAIQEMMQQEGHLFRELAIEIQARGPEIGVSWNGSAIKKSQVQEKLSSLGGRVNMGVEPDWS
ncbi:MAG: hypothetical protein ACK502_05200 [Alphaproteobacteria bacterium]|jgi:hypothetical protein